MQDKQEVCNMKVIWFSRHKMSESQRAALGDCEIVQINKTISSAYELKDEISCCDVIAIVAPIDLQKQFLDLAGDKPVIMAVNERKLVKSEDGKEHAEFNFVKWERLVKIEVETEDFSIED